MERVNQAKAAEDEKKRLEAERKQAEVDRQKRNEQLLKDMSLIITETKAKLDNNAHCLDAGSIEEVGMILEQAAMVVEAEEIDMAGDIKQLLDMYVPAVDAAIEGCGAAPPPEEPAPEEAVEGEAPAEGGEAPAEGEAAPPEGAEEPTP